MKTIAVQQPYFFPYLTYYQLAATVDEFVFLDDANFRKGGFVARNKVLVDGKPKFLSFPVRGQSCHARISDSVYVDSAESLVRKLSSYYRSAPFLEETLQLLEDVIDQGAGSVSATNSLSILKVFDLLGLPLPHRFSSMMSVGGNGLQRVLDICSHQQAHAYVNLPGGMSLYRREDFESRGIQLWFVQSRFPEYRQGVFDFTPGLSMIDILMWNERPKVREMVRATALDRPEVAS